MYKRVSLEMLLQQTAKEGKERKEHGATLRAERTGKEIQNLSVRDFYAACLNARGLSEEKAAREQGWISDCIETMLGVKSTRTLSMQELANRISAALNAPDLTDEDRWALYELCFMLTAQMRGPEAVRLTWRNEGQRIGTPQLKEPQSLYVRVGKLRKSRSNEPHEADTIEPGGPEKSGTRQSLGQVLQNAGAAGRLGGWLPAAKLPYLNMDAVCLYCMTAKHNSDPREDMDVVRCIDGYDRFQDAVSQYTGEGWSDSHSLQFLAGHITGGYLAKTRTRRVKRYEVLQTYELCYEFINLLADREHSVGHVSMMVREGLDARFDVDAKMK